jgi:hypothetical protein
LMAHRSAVDFLVLHALKLKGFADAGTVAELSALPVADVERQLDIARRSGDAERREGPISGWSLTRLGRTHHSVLLGVDVEASEASPVLVDVYPEFSEINARFKQVCTDWQLRVVDGNYGPNRHDDPSYDRLVVAALGQVDDRVQPICRTLAAVLDRMSPYGRRLSAALARVQAGDRESFTRPLANSYHDVWMEMDGDLVVTMNVARIAVDV